MQKKVLLPYLLTFVSIMSFVYLSFTRSEFLTEVSEQPTTFVRKISGLPDGKRDWTVKAHLGRIFVIDLTNDLPPFYVARIDPDTEKIIEEFTTKHWQAIAISAERESRSDSWLAEDYDYWILDEQNSIAYALKPTSWEEYDLKKRYAGVYVIDLKTRQVKRFLEVSSIGTIVLHPDRRKLYVMREPAEEETEEETEIGEIRIYSTTDWTLIKKITYSGLSVLDAKFTKDGNKLFCCIPGRGIIVLNTIDDEIEVWEESVNYPATFGFNIGVGGFIFSLDISFDERELYIAAKKENYGIVSAIDIAQKKLIRTLNLGLEICTSVVVIGEKLFAACLDGVYVIDIPSWRQQ